MSDSQENNSLQIDIPPTIGDFDRLVSATLDDKTNIPKQLILNLREVKYFEVACLIYLTSLIKSSIQQNIAINLRLPKSKQVRDFFRAWHFPQALKEATGIPFNKIVSEEDLTYFGENPSLKDQKYAPRIRQYGDQYLIQMSTDYFPILTFRKPEVGFNYELALKQANRWATKFVMITLKQRLHGPPGYFASRIVFEALMNAVRHPNATLIQMASHYIEHKKEGSKSGFFTLICWDDGKSIIDTLKGPFEKGQEISSIDESLETDKYKLVYQNEKGDKATPIIVDSNFVPSADSVDSDFLFASILPGITSDVKGIGHRSHPDVAEDKQFKLPGMGLHLLINAATIIYGGEIAFRTREYFMNIKRSDSDDNFCDYNVTLRKMSSSYEFLGNMLIIRLPINY